MESTTFFSVTHFSQVKHAPNATCPKSPHVHLHRRCSSSTAVAISPPLPLSTSGSPLVNFSPLVEISQRFSDAAVSSYTPFILPAAASSPSSRTGVNFERALEEHHCPV
ncbi:hypothetical protein Adt_03280 [Abeliophyllum distichum]|uniref:Uncharacterized protein n=1 Tax=Abeliophyllum distichum TaxID=126358 RepID=A0ABD1VYB1_9LAMI